MEKTTAAAGTTPGEGNVFYGLIDGGGGGGDACVYLAQCNVYGNAGGGLGGEMQTRRLNSSGQTVSAVDVNLAASIAGVANFGAVATFEARNNVIDYGIVLDTFDESTGTAGATPSLVKALAVRSGRLSTAETIVLYPNGDLAQGLPTDRITTRYDSTTHSLRRLNTAGSSGLDSLDQSGNYSAAGTITSPMLITGWYTVATVPSAAAHAGAIIGISDGVHGSKGLFQSDGGSWLASAALTITPSTT